jgi:hypothetical protein
MEGARAREAKRSARGKRSVYAAKGPCARARGATVRTRGERRVRGIATGATRDSDARASVRPDDQCPQAGTRESPAISARRLTRDARDVTFGDALSTILLDMWAREGVHFQDSVSGNAVATRANWDAARQTRGIGPTAREVRHGRPWDRSRRCPSVRVPPLRVPTPGRLRDALRLAAYGLALWRMRSGVQRAAGGVRTLRQRACRGRALAGRVANRSGTDLPAVQEEMSAP